MDKPIRTSISGPEAMPLLNRGKAWLRYIERMPDQFPGNPILSEAFRNSLANRTLVAQDGSTLRMQRGPINFVQASVPSMAGVLQGEEYLAAGRYLCIDAYDPVFSTPNVVVLFPMDARLETATPIVVVGQFSRNDFRIDTMPEWPNIGKHTPRVVSTSKYLIRELCGKLTSSTILTQDTTGSSVSTVGWGAGTATTTVYRRKLTGGGVDLTPQYEQTAVVRKDHDPGGFVMSDSATTFCDGAYCVNSHGFQTSPSLAAMQEEWGDEVISGTVASNAIAYGYVSEERHIFMPVISSRERESEFRFNDAAIALFTANPALYYKPAYSGPLETIAGALTWTEVGLHPTGRTMPSEIPLTSLTDAISVVMSLTISGETFQLDEATGATDSLGTLSYNYLYDDEEGYEYCPFMWHKTTGGVTTKFRACAVIQGSLVQRIIPLETILGTVAPVVATIQHSTLGAIKYAPMRVRVVDVEQRQ